MFFMQMSSSFGSILLKIKNNKNLYFMEIQLMNKLNEIKYQIFLNIDYYIVIMKPI